MSDRIKIFSTPIDSITFDQTISTIVSHLIRQQQIFVATPNPEMLLATLKNPAFREVLASTDLNIPDGIGLLWAATYLDSIKNNKSRSIKIIKAFYYLICVLFHPATIKKILPQRVTGSDLMNQLCESIKSDAKIFLLGADPGVAEETAKILHAKYKNIIVGTDSGSSQKSDEDRIIEKINKSDANLLFVAFGAPTQELWISKNISALKHIKCAIGIGGAFDFISSKVKRAPAIMQKLGLEWLYRLYKQPSRIKRIFNATVVFPYKIISSSF